MALTFGVHKNLIAPYKMIKSTWQSNFPGLFESSLPKTEEKFPKYNISQLTKSFKVTVSF